MRRKIVGVVAVVAMACLCSGCMGISKKEFNQNLRGKTNALQGGLRNISKFVDRHLFNYTWDDPYAFSDIYAGR